MVYYYLHSACVYFEPLTLVPPFTVVVMELYGDLERRFHPMLILRSRPMGHIPYVV